MELNNICMKNLKNCYPLNYVMRLITLWGGVVVKALCYLSDGLGIDSR